MAAEGLVERSCEARGLVIAARRWRGSGGEIDLVARQGAALVFIEVKRAATHEIAAARLSSRQSARIRAAASEYVAGEPAGQDTDMAFLAALVDDAGRVLFQPIDDDF